MMCAVLVFVCLSGLTPMLTNCGRGQRKRLRSEQHFLEPYILETWVKLVGQQSQLRAVQSPIVAFTGQHRELTIEVDGKEHVLSSKTGNFVLKSAGRSMIICAQPKRQHVAGISAFGWERVQALLHADDEQRGIDYLLLAACIKATTGPEKKRLLETKLAVSDLD